MSGPPGSLCLRRAMQFLPALLPVFVCCLPLVWGQQQPAPDTLTLLQFKQQLEADPTGLVNNSWNENTLDSKGCPMNWYGVSCSDDGSVTELTLENLALEGELQSGTLGNLLALVSLSLANNSFRGSIPDDLTRLSNIVSLNLSSNVLDGPIPGSLLMLPSLKTVNLSGNGLNGSVPSVLSASLIGLDLSGNRLSGNLPAALSSLIQLVSLNLSLNNLDGSIPTGFENLLQLTTLDLHGNGLSGGLDPSLLSLNKTTYVDFSSNKFSGGLPWQDTQFGVPSGFSVIEYVNLSHNQLSDTLGAAGVVFAAKLTVLDISANALYGELPSFQYATALKTLRLSENSFSGAIPDTLLTSSSLADLDLSSNLLTGAVVPITGSSLMMLNLSYNNLNGSLPILTGPCQSLDLSSNNFSGDLSELQNWGSTLQLIDLSSNEFTGLLLPGNLMQLFQLQSFNVSHNMLSGVVPDPFGSSRTLSVVDLSFNQFSGSIPLSLFYSTVNGLYLSHNQFTGQIPISDSPPPASAPGSTLKSLSYFHVLADSSSLSPLLMLDLSSNQLTRAIPAKIGSILTLQNLNLSSNKLSGQIPPQLNQLSNLEDLDLSQNQLSGPLPPQLPKSLQELNVSRNSLNGSVPLSLTKFPQSSFFPGNTALQWPLTTLPEPSWLRAGGGMKGKVKAGLIGGCTAGGVLVVALGLFIYYKCSSRSTDSSSGSEYSDGLKRDLEIGHPNAVPSVVTGKSVNAKRDWSSPNENGTTEVTVDGDNDVRDPSPARNHWFPVERIMSPEHLFAAKVSPEHPIDVKVASPEHLVGDVFFLDKGLSFSLEDLSRAPAEVLGRSSHGTSYKAVLGPEHILVVKWLKEGLAKSKKSFGMEAKKFGNVKHQNIVPTKGYYWGPREHEKLLLSGYITGASLSSRLFGGSHASLTWEQRLKVAVDISGALLYLHSRHRWAHGNIKATNILLAEDARFEAYLSDYCLDHLMTLDGTANQIVNSSALGYCAPELSVAKKPKPSMKSDVFSFGVILMELITGKSAGDIISGQTGVVDLPDWVKLVAVEGHAIDCYDIALVGVDRDLEVPKGIENVLALCLKCAGPQTSRPRMRSVHEILSSINPR